MTSKGKLIRVYSGSQISVKLLQEELERSGIGCFVQDDFQSGVSAGFYGGTPGTVDLYIRERDVMPAQLILREYKRINNNEHY